MPTEAEFQSDVVNAAKLFGLAVYHTFDSRRSEAGFPDLTIVGARGVLFRELKTDTGKLRKEQQYWLSALRSSGANVKVWRPKDWDVIVSELQGLGRVPVGRPAPSQADVRRRLQWGR